LKFQNNLKYRIVAKELASFVSDKHSFEQDNKLVNFKNKLNKDIIFRDNIIKEFKNKYNININKIFLNTIINYFLEHEHKGKLIDLVYDDVYKDEVNHYVIKNNFKTTMA